MANSKYADILEQSSVPKKVWKTALYLRLSRDDGTESESNSIASQREILKEYIKRYPDMEIYDIYVDDGYGSINIAEINDGSITPEHADYLRKKFLFK